jgi:hypothetical protein
MPGNTYRLKGIATHAVLLRWQRVRTFGARLQVRRLLHHDQKVIRLEYESDDKSIVCM